MSEARPPRRYLPGFLVLVFGAVVAYATAGTISRVDPLILAIGIGVVIGNTVGIPTWAEPGVALQGLFLETGIVLLGASVALSELLSIGPRIALLICATVLFGVIVVEVISRLIFRLSGPLPSLLAAGSSICGVSAVAAIGQVIGARDERLALAAATILLFDAVTLLVFPIAGRVLGLTSLEYGVWAGLSMFSTGPVAAAGFAHSAEAGEWAIVTKLARNSLLGLVAIGYSAVYTRSTAGLTASLMDPNIRQLWTDFPKFLVGFFLVAAITNFGVLSPASVASISAIADWLFILAFVGLGTAIRVETIRKAGLAPVLIILMYLLAISTVSLSAIRLFL